MTVGAEKLCSAKIVRKFGYYVVHSCSQPFTIILISVLLHSYISIYLVELAYKWI